MAYVQEKLKGKKIVSFKFKACVGRDGNGKQIFKCTTWYPPAELTPAKARKEAQKVVSICEDEVRQSLVLRSALALFAICHSRPSRIGIFLLLYHTKRKEKRQKFLISIEFSGRLCYHNLAKQS